MNLIPYRKFVIHINKSPEQISRAIGRYTTTDYNIFYYKVTTPFVGKIDDDGFKIEKSGFRPGGYYEKNSFAPVNVGKYKETGDGVDIVITQRLIIPVIAFSLAWILIGMYLTLALLYVGEIAGAMFPLGMVLFLYALIMPTFNAGAEIAKKEIEMFLSR